MTFDEKKQAPAATTENGIGGRMETLDLLRGFTLISMILYHGMWDFIYLSDTGSRMTALKDWYRGPGGFCWQQSICWTFILLSGFCVLFSKRIFRRGIQVSGAGLLVSAVTLLWMYDERVLWGVLSFLGAAMLLSGAIDRIPGKQPKILPASAGLVLCCILFYITRWVNIGFLQLLPGVQLALPECLYTEGAAGALLTAAGFPMKGFFSTDYFSMIPWFFLFRAGYYLHYVLKEKGLFSHPGFHLRVPVLNTMGKHSLLIYLIHQPLLYLLVSLLF